MKQIAVQEAIRNGKKVWVPADPKLNQIPTLISIPTTEDETKLLRQAVGNPVWYK